MRLVNSIGISLLLFFVVGCAPKSGVYVPNKLQFQSLEVSKSKPSQKMEKLLAPYADSVSKTMNKVLGYCAKDLFKKQPEGSLGNFLCDAMLDQTQKKYNKKIDAAFVNYGGIRQTTLPKGNVTIGQIFEIAPFDNTILVLDIPGNILKQFLDHISGRGGWPVAGLTWTISQNKAKDILIAGQPLDELGVYKIALVDYVANGGDDCKMLIPLKREDNGFLFRNAILKHIENLTSQSKNIDANLENRVKSE